jgi:hypothetical protein
VGRWMGGNGFGAVRDALGKAGGGFGGRARRV